MKVESNNIVEMNMDLNSSVNQAGGPQTAANQQAINGLSNSNAVEASQITEQVQSQQSNRNMNREEMQQVAEKLQEFMGSMNTSLRFSVDEESGRDVIKVMDRDSGELVRQFPSEEVLDVIKSLSNATGMLFDETA